MKLSQMIVGTQGTTISWSSETAKESQFHYGPHHIHRGFFLAIQSTYFCPSEEKPFVGWCIFRILSVQKCGACLYSPTTTHSKHIRKWNISFENMLPSEITDFNNQIVSICYSWAFFKTKFQKSGYVWFSVTLDNLKDFKMLSIMMH